tara:strand:+ start:2453 stop:2770 length:318 start_codon:yes stop_codon:yes gene_type:complete
MKFKSNKDLAYVFKIEVDVDCQNLLDTLGLDYYEPDDSVSNRLVKIITIRMSPKEYDQLKDEVTFDTANEEQLASLIVSPELGDYTLKVTLYKPNGNTVTFGEPK